LPAPPIGPPGLWPGRNVIWDAQSNWLLVASGARGGSDSISTFALDPATGAVQPQPVLDALPTGFGAGSIAWGYDGIRGSLGLGSHIVYVGGTSQILSTDLPQPFTGTIGQSTTIDSFFGAPSGFVNVTACPFTGHAVAATGGLEVYLHGWASPTSLSPVSVQPFGNLGNCTHVAVDPTAAFFYVVTDHGELVTLSFQGSTPTTISVMAPTAWSFGQGVLPRSIAIDPQGICLYSVESDGKGLSSVTAFPLTAPGTLGAPTTLRAPAAADYEGLAIDPTGQFLVVTDLRNSQAQAFALSVSNAWTPSAQAGLAPAGPAFGSAPTLPSPQAVSFNQGGLVCYVVDQPATGAARVHALLVGSSGLTPIANSNGDTSVALRPSARPTALVATR
jgi:DNA-binding beta-propeller fold protein YncE